MPSDYLLVTAEGGIDGFPLLDAVLRAIRLAPLPIPTVLVAGPMMAAVQVAALMTRAAGLDARIFGFRPDMIDLVAHATAVVAMAGYNTVAEILASSAPALLVPRTFPRREQRNRAERLARQGRVRLLDPEQLDPQRVRDEVERLLAQPQHERALATGTRDAIDILKRAMGLGVATLRAGEGISP